MKIQEGSVARYLVREQFVRRNFPNDAIGETSEVNGSITFDAHGNVVSDHSIITVNLRSLRSDDDDRDDFLQTDSLESIKFPLAEFVVEDTRNLPWPLPENRDLQFELLGRMKVHGVTKPITWDVMMRLSPDGLTGQAKTSFEFDTFDMERPSVFFLLTVDDNIRLELDLVGAIIPGFSG